MDAEQPIEPTAFLRVLARIHLLPTIEGGRATPVRGSYRPNHNFFGPDNSEMAMGFLELAPGDSLAPGDVREFEIAICVWPRLTPELTPGREWRLQEGRKVVGTGTILRLMSGAEGAP